MGKPHIANKLERKRKRKMNRTLFTLCACAILVCQVFNANGQQLEPWQYVGTLPSIVDGEYVAISGNHIYGIDHNNGATWYAPLQSNGVSGTWIQTSAQSTLRISATVVATADTIYSVGGHWTAGTPTTFVQFAKINTDAALGSWTAASSFNTRRSDPAVTIKDGYIYVAGGWSANFTFLNSVEFAEILSDGSLGSWQTTTSMQTLRPHATIAAINGYLYAFGGGRHGYATSTVERALINPDGSIGTWTYDLSLPESRTNHGLFILGNKVYIVGGYDGSNRLLSLVSTTVQPDHTLSSWSLEES